MKLDGEKLLEDIKKEIEIYKNARDSAAKLEWFEKAGRKHVEIEGMMHIRQLIELGDYTIKETK